MQMPRASFYKHGPNRLELDGPIIKALQAVLENKPSWGFWKCYDRLRGLGHAWNHKKVYRVYCSLGLNKPRRTKKRVLTRERQSMEVMPMVNNTWSMDFVHDTLYSNNKRFRTLNILDEGVREVLAIEIDSSLPAARVVRVMEQLKEWRGLPNSIRCDNGPEFLATIFVDWCKQHEIEIKYIQPGKPNQNAFIERFNRTYRDEVLNLYLFEDLDQVRDITHEWLDSYNEERPHDALGGMTPSCYRKLLEAKSSTFELST